MTTTQRAIERAQVRGVGMRVRRCPEESYDQWDVLPTGQIMDAAALNLCDRWPRELLPAGWVDLDAI